MSGASVVRIVMGGIGLLMLLGGLVLAGSGAAGDFVLPVIWLIGSGAVLVVVATIEVTRYRSEAAERAHIRPGPGGGETGHLEARFRPTDEVFVDPTAGRRMRVFADPATGERRYVAEGQ